ncbi:MAG: 50S ribosomal protein L6 [Phycisphaerales bacterium]
MSRIGRKHIPVPASVKVAIKDNTITLTGSAGVQTITFKPQVKVKWTESEKSIACSIDEKDAQNREVSALWGTTRALIASAIEGVTKGFQEEMEVVGVGWTAAVVGQKLKLVVGYANPIMMDIPKDLKVIVDKQIVRLSGPSKQVVGQFASTMRAHRKPEPYNGKGIKYFKEVIKKKSGKAFGTA